MALNRLIYVTFGMYKKGVNTKHVLRESLYTFESSEKVVPLRAVTYAVT